MPYFRIYENVLKELGVNYKTLVWDRLEKNEVSDFIYSDKLNKHSRGAFEYYKFSCYIREILTNKNYRRVIVFGIQIAFFLSGFLKKNYSGRYIFDIRDYHYIMKIWFGANSFITNSEFCTISSVGFMDWLPQNNKYYVSHNARDFFLEGCASINFVEKKYPLNIACIGSLKDFEINEKLMTYLRNSKTYRLSYHGDGVINQQLEDFIVNSKIFNASVTGEYFPEAEGSLYESADYINMLMSSDSINNNTCMANRLYNAVFYGKSLIVMNGSFMANVVEKYNLGVVLDSLLSMENRLADYEKNFNIHEYNKNRRNFMDVVKKENKLFKEKLINTFSVL
jgi:hypothetical protein